LSGFRSPHMSLRKSGTPSRKGQIDLSVGFRIRTVIGQLFTRAGKDYALFLTGVTSSAILGSIAHRVRRKRHRLTTNRSIESAPGRCVSHVTFFAGALPIKISYYTAILNCVDIGVKAGRLFCVVSELVTALSGWTDQVCGLATTEWE